MDRTRHFLTAPAQRGQTGELYGAAARALPTPERIRARPRPRPAAAFDYLVAFGEYIAGDAGPGVSLNSPFAPPGGQSGQGRTGIEGISDSMQLGVAQSQDATVNPYTGAQPPPSPLTADPYSGGPSAFYPWGAPANAFNGPVSGPTGAPSAAGGGAQQARPSAQTPSASTSPGAMAFPVGPAAVGLQPYLPGGGMGSSPFIGAVDGAILRPLSVWACRRPPERLATNCQAAGPARGRVRRPNRALRAESRRASSIPAWRQRELPLNPKVAIGSGGKHP
jgi:hypothetical protein